MFKNADITKLSKTQYRAIIETDEFNCEVYLEDDLDRQIEVIITMAIQLAYAEANLNCAESLANFFKTVGADELHVVGPGGYVSGKRAALIQLNKQSNPLYTDDIAKQVELL